MTHSLLPGRPHAAALQAAASNPEVAAFIESCKVGGTTEAEVATQAKRGIDTGLVDKLSFAVGCGLAGVAGAAVALRRKKLTKSASKLAILSSTSDDMKCCARVRESI